MAVSQESLSVEVVLDAKGAIQGVRDLNGNFVSLEKVIDKATATMLDAQRGTDGLGRSSEQAGKKASGAWGLMGESLSKAFVPITALNQGLQLITATVNGIVSSVGGFVTAFAQAELAQAKLAKSLALVGSRVNGTADDWDRYLDVVEKTTGKDADLLKGLVATSLQIGRSEKQTKALVDASVKLSDVTGDSVATSFDQLLQSYKGNVRALEIYAPEVKALTEAQKENGEAVDVILGKYKNISSTFSTTLAGSIQGASIGFQDLREAIGESIAEATGLDGKLKGLTSAFKSIENVIKAVDFGAVIQNLTTFGVVAGGVALVAVTSLRSGFISLATSLYAAAIPATLLAAKFALIGASLTAVILAVDIGIRNFSRMGDVLDTLASAVGVTLLSAVEAGAGALADLFGMLPGAEMLAGSFRMVAQEAGKAGQKVLAFGTAASDGLDFGIAGTLLEQGQKAFAAFGGAAEDTGNKLKNASDKAGAKPGSLMDPEALKKITEEAKRAGEAFLGMGESLKNLQAQSTMLELELGAGAEGLSAAEKTYQTTLQTIAAEREKAIAMGVSAKAADDQAAAQVKTALYNKQLTEGLKVQQDVYADIKKNNDAVDASMAGVRTQVLAQSESLLRVGMTRGQLIEREYQVELDKLEAIEDQAKAANKLDASALEQLRLARANLGIQKEIAKSEAARQTGGLDAPAKSDSDKDDSKKPSGVQKALEVGQSFLDKLGKVPNLVTQIISAIARLPQLVLGIVEGATELFDKQIFEFPKKLLQALERQFAGPTAAKFEAFINSLAQTMPRIFVLALSQIPKKLSAMTAYFIPQIIGQLVGSIIEALPEIIGYSAQAFSTEIPRIILLLIAGIVRAFGTIFKSLGKALPRLVPVMVAAMIEGWKEVVAAWKSIFTGKSPFENAGKTMASGFQNSMKKMTGFSGDLFSITDDNLIKDAQDKAKSLTEEARKAGRSIWDAFKKAIMMAWEWLKTLGGQIWAGFVEKAQAAFDLFKRLGAEAWKAIKSGAETAYTLFNKLGQYIWNAVVVGATGAWDLFTGLGKILWKGVVDSVSTIWESLKTSGTYIWEGLKALFSGDGSEAMVKFREAGAAIWTGLSSLLGTAGETFSGLGLKIWESFKAAFSNGTDLASNFGSAISNAFMGIVQKLKDVFNNSFSAVGTSITNVLNSIPEAIKRPLRGLFGGLANVLDGMYFPEVGFSAFGRDFGFGPFDLVPDSLTAPLRFAEGGMVPGMLGSGDTVDARMQPGEFVMRRTATNSIGPGVLERMNKTGQVPAAAGDVNISLNINTEQPIDEAYVRRTLMPAIKQEMRAASLRGEFLLSQRGIRSGT